MCPQLLPARFLLASALILAGCPQLLDDEFADPSASAAGASDGGLAGNAGNAGETAAGGAAGAAGNAGSGPARPPGPPTPPGGMVPRSCSDGRQSPGETGVDCGGACGACTCEAYGPFSTPELLTGLGLSGELWGASLSSDGATLAFAQTADASEDIFLAQRALGATFRLAAPATGIDTDEDEGSTFQAASGLSLYFYSSRGAVGGRDLYVATRLNTLATFSGATLLGGVNSTSNDHQPWLSPDELRIYFTSNRAGGSGRNDIYTATRGSRLAAFTGVRGVTELDSAEDDEGATFSSDELTVFLASDRDGNSDIWTATRASTTAAFGTPTLVPELSSGASDLNTALSSDGREIIFSSERNGTAQLFRATRECE